MLLSLVSASALVGLRLELKFELRLDDVFVDLRWWVLKLRLRGFA